MKTNCKFHPVISRFRLHFVVKSKIAGCVIFYGRFIIHCRKIAPTILLDVPEDSLIMEEEIFGPLLPILTVRTFLILFPVCQDEG